MAQDWQRSISYLQDALGDSTAEEAGERLKPRFDGAPRRIAGATRVDAATVQRRWDTITADASLLQPIIADAATLESAGAYCQNIENFIGTVKVPVGVAGPLRINGLFAQGDFYVPLATSEAALVASYSRGASLITEAGGCASLLLSEGVVRAPGFAFTTLADAGKFACWIVSHFEELKYQAESTTRHGKLKDLKLTLEGNHVYVIFEYTTGDAAGQNMVTIATMAACEYVITQTPIKPAYWFVEANASGDKKASYQSFATVRGKKVTAEAIIPAKLIKKRLHTTPEKMVDYWRMSALGGVISGTIGVQGHYANGLAALFLATGQDIACVAEAATGVTRYELTADGDLYASATLPNLIVGTVGGGTKLPSQQACLKLLGLAGDGNAKAFAEVCGALSLAGELSIIGALAAGDFAKAHERYARGRTKGMAEPDALD